MNKTHNLKLDYEFCDAVLNGEKTFEIRINDRGFQKGDFIQFTAIYGACRLKECHPINNEKFEISYLLYQANNLLLF